MNYRIWILVVVVAVAVVLVGCSSKGGPSDAEARAIIYGVYFKDARILDRQQCELTSWMQDEGHTRVWLIRYRFEDTGSEGGLLLTETDSQEEPWQIYLPNVDRCPAAE